MRHSISFLTAALFCAAAVLLSIGQAFAAGRAGRCLFRFGERGADPAAQRAHRLYSQGHAFPPGLHPLVCAHGSANEEPRHAGISHVLEHMVFKGHGAPAQRPGGREVEALGGYLNAATSFDKTWYLTDMPAAHWRTGMDVVKDMAFQAQLDPKELEAEKNVVISELQRGEDSPMRKLYENLQVAGSKIRLTAVRLSAMWTPSRPLPPKICATMSSAGTSRRT